jgi:hypothetical protein
MPITSKKKALSTRCTKKKGLAHVYSNVPKYALKHGNAVSCSVLLVCIELHTHTVHTQLTHSSHTYTPLRWWRCTTLRSKSEQIHTNMHTVVCVRTGRQLCPCFAAPPLLPPKEVPRGGLWSRYWSPPPPFGLPLPTLHLHRVRGSWVTVWPFCAVLYTPSQGDRKSRIVGLELMSHC